MKALDNRFYVKFMQLKICLLWYFMKGRVPTFGPLYHIPSILMAWKYLFLFKKPS